MRPVVGTFLALALVCMGLFCGAQDSTAPTPTEQSTSTTKSPITPATDPHIIRTIKLPRERYAQVEYTGDKLLWSKYREFVDGLGYVIKVDSGLAADSVKTLETKLVILTRNKPSGTQVEFLHKDTFHVLEQANASDANQQHWYEFDFSRLLESDFDPRRKTIVHVGGFQTPANVDWMNKATKLWLQLGDFNVIEVTWAAASGGKFGYFYASAAAGTPRIARLITILLHYLAQASDTSIKSDAFLANVHLIGHSLGAHICGFVGQDLDGRVGRITGLDVAGPSFDLFPDEMRLDRGDARLVDTLMTNMGQLKYIDGMKNSIMTSLFEGSRDMSSAAWRESQYETDGMDANTGWFGIRTLQGHVNYLANNGRVQPNCSDATHVCDHRRTTALYVDLLTYELRYRQLAGAQASQAGGQLLALRAHNYTHLMSGGAFAHYCPQLLAGLPSVAAHEVWHPCTQRLNLVAGLDELQRELAKHSSPDNEPLKFVLRTRGGDPHYFGPTYVLKLYLGSALIWPPRECYLNITMSHLLAHEALHEVAFTLIQLDQVLQHAWRTAATSVTVPFAYAGGADAAHTLGQLLDTGAQLALNNESALKRTFPALIELKLVPSGQPAKSKTQSVLEDGSCELGLTLAEVQPIVNHASAQTLAMIYKVDERDYEQTAQSARVEWRSPSATVAFGAQLDSYRRQFEPVHLSLPERPRVLLKPERLVV